jgi:hypothetical protein
MDSSSAQPARSGDSQDPVGGESERGRNYNALSSEASELSTASNDDPSQSTRLLARIEIDEDPEDEEEDEDYETAYSGAEDASDEELDDDEVQGNAIGSLDHMRSFANGRSSIARHGSRVRARRLRGRRRR